MDFDKDSQLVNPAVHHETLFSGDRPIDTGVPIDFPALSLATIESIFAADTIQTPQPNRLEDFSLKENRLLENGQIKLFTQAIDSYYHSTVDLSSVNSSGMTISTDTTNSNRNCHNQETTLPTYQYSNLPENPMRMIRTKYDSKDQKIWNSNVGKKILAVEFSPMNIKSEFLSKQTILDGFESFAVQEAVNALYNIVIDIPRSEDVLNQYRADLYADPRPADLVHSCGMSRAFRKLNLHDKVILLKNAFLDLNSLRNITVYNPAINGWYFGHKICSREKLFSRSPSVKRKAFRLMDTFPQRFRNDLYVGALLCLILIFNGDVPKLKFRNQIKSEQYIYIYLLRRYLVSTIEPTCEALEYFYQLMATIEEVQTMKRAIEQEFDGLVNDGAFLLKNRVVRFIELESLKQ